MSTRLEQLPADHAGWRAFLATYQRTTVAVGEALTGGHFDDPAWVDEWDVSFARLYLDAHDAALAGGPVPRPWRLAFQADPALHDLVRVLLGMNAHINYDLPQALLAVISVADFDDPVLLDRRRRDHERIDRVLAARVAQENVHFEAVRLVDRLTTPLNIAASRRFLKEAREKVWHNVLELDAARRRGEDAYRVRLAELEVLCAAKVADLLAPGQVLLRLAMTGFGVTLPPPA